MRCSNVHLRGAFLMTKAVQAHMVEAGWGRIVNLSSTSALGNRGQANYAAAKAGMQGFTKTLAIELGRFGVTANAIAPGFIVTEMTASTARRVGMEPDEFFALMAKEIPVGRAGEPADIAAAAAFFVERGGVVHERPGALRGGRSPRMSLVFVASRRPARRRRRARPDRGSGSRSIRPASTRSRMRRATTSGSTSIPERAASGPFGATVAHGYLTLSLLPALATGLLEVGDLGMAVNYGLDKVRFIQAVPSGSRVRVSAVITDAVETPIGIRLHQRATVEIEGHDEAGPRRRHDRPLRPALTRV